MFEQYIRLPRVLARIRASAFAPELEALVEYLQRRGHRRHAIAGYLLGAEHLADCIDKKLVSLDGLTADGLQQFARTRAMRLTADARVRPPTGISSASLATSSSCCESRVDVDRLPQRLCRGRTWIRCSSSSIGICETSVVSRVRAARATYVPSGRCWSPSTEARSSIRQASPCRTCGDGSRSRAAVTSPRTARKLAQTLRSLVRFFVLHGEPVAHLVTAVPMVPTSRLSALPRGLSDPQLAQLTRSIDVSKPIGLRARAIVECAATLGLRAGGVAALRITDIDWRGGTIHLPRTKSRRGQVLPLQSVVGRVLVSYLKRGRPNSSTDRVFVHHYMPVGRALQSKDVTQTVGRAMRRAGLQLPLMGAHVLRHTAASRLVRAGVGMKDIADVMRHQDIDTTRIYAKVDWPRLTEVALPWPTSEAP
jgi:integrase/recombinase XerD